MPDAPTVLAWVESTTPGSTYHAVTGHTTTISATTRCGLVRGNGVTMMPTVAGKGAYRFTPCAECWAEVGT